MEIKLLWVDDDTEFGPAIEFRLNTTLVVKNLELVHVDLLQDGNFIWETVRQLKPHIVMMDHNLQDVKRNGANFITEIRLHDNELPIIFYSSEMGPALMQLVQGENRVFTSTRNDVHAELMRLISAEFT